MRPFSVLVVTSSILCSASLVNAQPSAPSPADYVMQSGQSDQFEIQEGQLAQQVSKSPPIQHFGAMMVKDHAKSTQMVTEAAAKSGLPPMPPPPLTSEQSQNLAALQAAAPTDFDAMYLRQQSKAHQDALQLQQVYASSGSDKNLKRVAAKIVPVVQMHASMITTLGSAQ